MAIKFNVKGGFKDMLNTVKLVLNCNKQYKDASDAPINNMPHANALAKSLHPKHFIQVKITNVEKWNDTMKSYTFEAADGGELPYFRAGQYITIKLNIGESYVSRAYSICAVPNTKYYKIGVRTAEFVGKYIYDNFKVGDIVTISAPEGNFYYDAFRDEKFVLALAGGSSITPYLSMAHAIEQGIEDFEMTLLFGVKNKNDLMLFDELKSIEKKTSGKFKVIYVLSDEEVVPEGMEKGFITAELMKKYLPKEGAYSVYLCGSPAMNAFVTKEVEKLGVDTKHFRAELSGEIKDPSKEPDYPKGEIAPSYKIKVRIYGEEKEIIANSNESLLIAFERAGLKTPSRCRAGECGFCRCRVISGEVYSSKRLMKLRGADSLYGYIHACVSFPISEGIVIEVYTEE